MLKQLFAMVFEECIQALTAEDNIEAMGYLERIKELLIAYDTEAGLIPEEVQVT